MLQELTDDNFDAALGPASGIYVVRFGAEWCGPCKVMSSIFKDVAGQMQESARFGEVDIDRSPALAARYGVQSIPTVLLFRNGEVIDRMTGATGKPGVVRFVSSHAA